MKKVIYSLAFGLLALSSCTTWDDPTTENYGAGPNITVGIEAAIPTDSAFVVTLTPASGTTYYAFVISSSKTDVDGATLLKGGYGNTVLNTTENPTFSLPIATAAPNTKYYVYAIASNDKGIIGDLALDSIQTTDKYIPTFVAASPTSDSRGIMVKFSEAVTRGTGKVTGKYYKEWDILNPVDVAEEEISVSIDGDVVTFGTANAPAGAFVCISYEEGAFLDAVGNKCPAMTSTLNMSTGKFTNLNYRVATTSFDITDENVTSPADGTVFPKYEDFKGVLTFDFDIYRNDALVEKGDLSVVYTNENRVATYALTPDQWSVEGKSLSFVLPAAPEAGDLVMVKISSDVIFDIYGNGNNLYVSTLVWKYFAMTKEMVLGTFKFAYQSAYDETPTDYDGSTITISENAEVENGLIIKNLWVEGSEIAGSYDISKGEIYIGAYQALGVITNSKGAKYGLITYSLSGADAIAFTVNADGTMVSTDLAIVACDENYESMLGYWEKCSIAVFSAQAASAASKRAARASKAKKVVKINGKQLKNRVRK